jgi:SpoIID/LytB domain protein
MSATASDELLKAHAVISRSWLLKPILTSPQPSPKEREKSNTPNSTHTSNDSRLFPFGEVGRGIVKWYERDAHTHFDVCADDHCQRYQGITRASTAAVEKAIEATRGEVLWADGGVCDARFSKSCGGASETFENCWAPEHYSYLTKVIDNPTEPEGFELDLTVETNAEKWIRQSPEAFCNTTDKKVLAQVLNNYDQETIDFYRWKVEYTQAEIKELLVRRSGIDFGEIMDLIPIKRGESARLIELKIIGTKQTIAVGKELEIRKWLSSSHLYSSAFVVDKLNLVNGIPQKFILTGAGWGHGVGLCQIGAAVMGEKGYLYNEILLHYFRGAELKRIYPYR